MFFFDTTGVQILDAWQRLPLEEGRAAYGVSASGGRRLAVLTASLSDSAKWLDIRTYADLCKRTLRLSAEHPDRPFLSGEALLEDARTRTAEVALSPLLTQICLRSVAADYTGRPYAGKPFHCHTLYISYAGVECHPLGNDAGRPLSWISAGPADSAAIKRLPHPEMLLQDGCGDIGPKRRALERDFYCYTGPQTRLVLGGTLDGEECYYPIPLPELHRGRKYLLEITLQRKGSPDPDIPTEAGAVQLDMVTVPWTRESPVEIIF